jgi:hypothetical protein
MLHRSLIGSQELCGAHWRSQRNPERLAAIEATRVVQCAIQIRQNSIE